MDDWRVICAIYLASVLAFLFLWLVCPAAIP